MGAWGAGIFDDDTACEVRDEFIELISNGHSAESATSALVGRWGVPDFDPDERTVFWLALAATQFRYGRLTEVARERAVEIIESGEDVAHFFNLPKLREKRSKALESLKSQLLGPARRPRNVKPIKKHQTTWEIGDIWSFQLPSGRLALLRVTGHHIDKGGRFAWVEVLEGEYMAIPNELRMAMTPGRRDLNGRVFRLFITPKYETAQGLKKTGYGRTKISAAARQVRELRLPRLAGQYSYIASVNSIDVVLYEHLGLN